MKFDVVVGNPPYNGPGSHGSGKAGSGSKIWQKFLPVAYSCLSEGGYVVFVHPTLRNNKSPKCKKAKDIWESNQLMSIRAGFQFPTTSALVWVDYYVLRKHPRDPSDQVTWVNRDCSSYLVKRGDTYDACYVSPLSHSILKKVLTIHTGDNGLKHRKAMGGLTKFDTSISGHFPFAHGAAASREEWKYLPHPHIDQNKLKVILIDNHDFRPIIDEGKLGVGDHVHYLIVNNMKQAVWFQKFVNSRISKWLQFVFSEQWNEKTGKNYSWNYPQPLSLISIRDTDETSDEDFYNLFSLTQEEIDYIERTVK